MTRLSLFERQESQFTLAAVAEAILGQKWPQISVTLERNVNRKSRIGRQEAGS